MAALAYRYGVDAASCTDYALELEKSLTNEGIRVFVITAQHFARLQLMEDNELDGYGAVIVDMAHECSEVQAQYLIHISEGLNIPVHAVGLRTDHNRKPYEGAMMLLAIADVLEEIPAVSADGADVCGDVAEIPEALAEFLDADSAHERLEVFRRIRDKVDDEMIDTIAVILDVDVPPGDIDKRKSDIINCLEMFAKYEVTRLR